MDQQTRVAERNGASMNEPHGLAWDLGSFANDAMTLTELQSQLLAADMRECTRRGWVPSLFVVGSAALGLACFPIALVTAALGLVKFFELSHFTAFLSVLVVGASGSILLGIIGWIKVRERAATLRRSRDELMRNLRWIKRVITRTRRHIK